MQSPMRTLTARDDRGTTATPTIKNPRICEAARRSPRRRDGGADDLDPGEGRGDEAATEEGVGEATGAEGALSERRVYWSAGWRLNG
jgi:hypothetical protein